MLRKLMSLSLACCIAMTTLSVGCSENEHKVTEKKETRTEGEVKDASPGEMVVE